MNKEKLKEKISIEYVDVKSLKFYPGNPRTFGEQEIQKVMGSFKDHGIINPLIVNSAPDRENIVLSGNLRLVAAQRLKLQKVPVVRICVSDPKKEKDILLKMNISNGSWDYDLLRSFDIDVVLEAGFKDFEISNIFDDALEVSEDEFDAHKELERIKSPASKEGDLYSLGENRLLCADSLNEKAIEILMSGKHADMVCCDPPFNISLDYNSGIGGKSSYGGHVDDSKSDEEYKEFLKQSITNAIKFSKKDSHYFYFSDQSYVWLIQTLYKKLNIKPVRTCLWIKGAFNPTPQVAFNKSYEPVTYGTRGKPYTSPKCPNLTEILNKQIATGNRQIDDILDQLDIWMVKRIAGQNYEHPTEKPATLFEKPLRRCTRPGDLILDMFAGSGPVMSAAVQLKRKVAMVEKEPIFVDLILKRFETLTGEKPKLIAKGVPNGKR